MPCRREGGEWTPREGPRARGAACCFAGLLICRDCVACDIKAFDTTCARLWRGRDFSASSNKGKGGATGPTGLPTMDYEAEMQFDDEEGDSDWEDPAADAKAVDSHTARQVRAILQGSRQTHHAGGSGSSGGRVPDIHPGTSAEFRYARNALKQAHRDNNANKKVLLTCIRKYISSCHAATN